MKEVKNKRKIIWVDSDNKELVAYPKGNFQAIRRRVRKRQWFKWGSIAAVSFIVAVPLLLQVFGVNTIVKYSATEKRSLVKNQEMWPPLYDNDSSGYSENGIVKAIEEIEKEETVGKQHSMSTPEPVPFVPSKFEQAVPTVGFDSLYQYFFRKTDKKFVGVDFEEKSLIISFDIEVSGRPSAIEISGLESDTLINIILEVTGNMPDWKPATVNGIAVKTRFSLPVSIINQEDQ